MEEVGASGRSVRTGFKNKNRRKMQDQVATAAFWLASAIVTMILAFLVGYIALHGWRSVDIKFLTSPAKNLEGGGGIGPQIFDSFYLLFLSMTITVPLGLGAAVFLSEYAKPNRFTALIRLCTETLSSLPSIVVGLFGLLVFVTYTGFGYSLLAGALALTVLNLPVMVRVSEDALRSVPMDLREASLALGANLYQTIYRVVIPAALPRLVTGIILASGRVFGEAAALIYTAGMSSPPLNWANMNPFNYTSPLNPLRPGETLAVHIWKINSESLIPDVRRVADGSAFVLVLVVVLFNVVARWLQARIYRKMTGTRAVDLHAAS
ncbi:MAG: phosphate ABC transporter permease PstA [Candidatus Fermentithermobacillus carboniphilus]|uniref:Phosphate transport system permease protein PstA n=1 Tax=Candidatus Fermentithermobacillus carboniphilus TaxID=3085328 RepID=A0AAT9LEC3_9FIRM|nr:MAG: phosphate ABC transporter permease PstA [Candidatus Fermentithermobacillus carboniphilus]